jgi:hypothetical protein
MKVEFYSSTNEAFLAQTDEVAAVAIKSGGGPALHLGRTSPPVMRFLRGRPSSVGGGFISMVRISRLAKKLTMAAPCFHQTWRILTR